MTRVSIDHLRGILHYCPESGILTWKERGVETFNNCGEKEKRRVSTRWSALRAGLVAGHVSASGYRVLCIEKKTYMAHRIAWAIVHGEWPKDQIDHINHDKTDNRLSNLRSVTGGQNCRNRRSPKNNTSGQIGVHFHIGVGQWVARAMVNGKRVQLGSFSDKEEAIKCRQDANRRLGFHDNHGVH